MSMPLDEAYFVWLYSRVGGSIDNKDITTRYLKLFRLLFRKEFTWVHEMDGNRAEDGKDLRKEFLRKNRGYRGEALRVGWMHEPCDFLEFLIALSFDISYEDPDGGSAEKWFWVMMRNVGLHIFNDEDPVDPYEVYAIVDRVLECGYDANGNGGLFPLNRANRDQRNVEYWDQANSYLRESVS